MPQPSVATVTGAAQIQALSHPTRVAILEALVQPASAADAARRIGQPRQLVNYHLKALHEAGLVELVEERRKGNFVESLYQAVARGFVVSPQTGWGPARIAALQQQHALGTLVDLGGRLQRDATALLEGGRDEEIPSATVLAEVNFTDEATRTEFFDAYLEAVQGLIEQYASTGGAPYRVVMAAYPAGESVEARGE